MLAPPNKVWGCVAFCQPVALFSPSRDSCYIFSNNSFMNKEIVFPICFLGYFIFPLLPLLYELASVLEPNFPFSPFDKRDILIATVWGITTGISAWSIEWVSRRKPLGNRNVPSQDKNAPSPDNTDPE